MPRTGLCDEREQQRRRDTREDVADAAQRESQHGDPGRHSRRPSAQHEESEQQADADARIEQADARVSAVEGVLAEEGERDVVDRGERGHREESQRDRPQSAVPPHPPHSDPRIGEHAAVAFVSTTDPWESRRAEPAETTNVSTSRPRKPRGSRNWSRPAASSGPSASSPLGARADQRVGLLEVGVVDEIDDRVREAA